MVLSFDGINEEALSYMAQGKIACIGECNPHHGPRVEALIQSIEDGGIPEKFNYVEESIFSTIKEVTTITVDGQQYTVANPFDN